MGKAAADGWLGAGAEAFVAVEGKEGTAAVGKGGRAEPAAVKGTTTEGMDKEALTFFLFFDRK